MFFLLMFTLWFSDTGDIQENVVVSCEKIEVINENDYIFMSSEMYEHLVGDSCFCSECQNGKEYEEEDWVEEDWEEAEDSEDDESGEEGDDDLD